MIERKLNSRITLLREKVKVIVANTRKMRRTTKIKPTTTCLTVLTLMF